MSYPEEHAEMAAELVAALFLHVCWHGKSNVGGGSSTADKAQVCLQHTALFLLMLQTSQTKTSFIPQSLPYMRQTMCSICISRKCWLSTQPSCWFDAQCEVLFAAPACQHLLSHAQVMLLVDLLEFCRTFSVGPEHAILNTPFCIHVPACD